MIRLILVCGSVWFCFQLLAVLIGWRLAPLRAQAVVEWQDPDPVDAQLDSNPREPLRDESREPVHPLMQEIYGALSLARDGVDIEKGAPKERAS